MLVWIVIAIALSLLLLWWLIQPQQGATAANAPRPSRKKDAPQQDATIANTPQPLSKTIAPEQTAAQLTIEVQQLMAEGKKIVAIKRVREVTGWGLKKAKRYVESQDGEIHSIADVDISRTPAADLATQVRYMLAEGKKIAAIKYVREQTGWGLKEAKDYVESL